MLTDRSWQVPNHQTKATETSSAKQCVTSAQHLHQRRCKHYAPTDTRLNVTTQCQTLLSYILQDKKTAVVLKLHS